MFSGHSRVRPSSLADEPFRGLPELRKETSSPGAKGPGSLEGNRSLGEMCFEPYSWILVYLGGRIMCESVT